MKTDALNPQSRYAGYLAADFSDRAPTESLLEHDRREFLKLVGGGIIVLMTFDPAAAAQREGGFAGRHELPHDFNAFLRIGEDGRVTGFTGKIEMGQGVITSLAQMLADELAVPLDAVHMVMGDTDLCPWDMGTFGSMTTRFFGPALRAAAAEAKAVLIELAAESLQIPKERLRAKDGAICTDGQQKITYAELAHGKQILRHVMNAPIENPADFTVIGKSALRKDSLDKVTGKAQYAGDVREPGMLFARILRPPAHGAKLISVDVAAARAVEGAQVVHEGNLIAVLHRQPDSAEAALAQIKAQYDRPAAVADDKSIFDHLLKVAPPHGETVAQGGDLQAGREAARAAVEEQYLNSYVAHAPIEPHTALAKVEGDKATIWASTQTPFALREAAATLLGVSPPNVRVIVPFVGGGFGGKSNIQQALEAVRLAKITGKHVQVGWTREEEFFYDTFRPAAVVKVQAGLDNAGLITFWDYGVYFAGERGAAQFYHVPNHRTSSYGSGWGDSASAHPFATGPWRAPGNNTNTFARESHIDALAARAGMDPVEFRLKNLADAKMRGVLQAVAEKFGWTPAKAPSGRGYGVACGMDAGAYVAHMAEVEVDKNSGAVRVKRVVCAQNMGLCINPEGARLQMEGAITMGMGYALSEEVQFTGGEIHDSNFDTYTLPHFSWLPDIETVIIDAPDSPAQGGGEPAIIGMGAVIANAIFDATGARLRQLPMTPERVKKGIVSGE